MSRERLALALGSFVFLYLAFFRGSTPLYLFSPIEGAVWIDEADRVRRGEVMYRDFFEFVPPGVVYMNAAVIALFGARIASLTALQVAMGVALALAVHGLAARVLAPGWRLLPPAAFLVLAYVSYSPGNHKWPALLFGMLGMLPLTGAGGGPRAALGGGALLGLSTLCTLDFGVGMAAGALASVSTDGRDRPGARAAALAAAWLAVVGLALAPFAAAAGARTLIEDCVWFPLTAYRAKNALFFGLASHRGPRTAAQLVLAVGGLLGALLALRRSEGAARVVALGGLGLALATAHRPWTPLLLAVRFAPLLVTLALALQRAHARPGFWRGLARAGLAVVLLGTAWGAVSVVSRRQVLDPMRRERTRAGELLTPSALPELSWIEARVPEGGTAFFLPHKGGIHFLTRTRSATAMPYLLDGMSTPAQVERAVADIARVRPRYGVWGNPGDLPQAYTRLLDLYEPEAEAANESVLLRLRAVPGG